MLVTALPNETIDAIIDHLHNDKHSLRACSLTCNGWLPSSRHHLFSEIRLTPSNVHEFRRMLDSSSHDIASIVRCLELYEFGVLHYLTSLLTRNVFLLSKLPTANDQLCSVLVDLRQVRVLRLIGSDRLDRDVLSKLTSVEELEIVAHSTDAFEVVDTFPELRKLSLDNIHRGSLKHLTQWPTALVPSLQLHILKLDPAIFVDVTKWLLGMNQMPMVHTLHCHAYDPVTSPNRDVMLQSVGPSLQSLHLDLGTH